jgi:hypothetical protein
MDSAFFSDRIVSALDQADVEYAISVTIVGINSISNKIISKRIEN